MAKKAILVFIALITGIAGIFLFYLFLKSINYGANIIFLLASFILIITSIILIIFSTRQKKNNSSLVDQEAVFEKTVNAIQKNNATLSEWEKTNEERDKLKLLKIQGAAEEESQQQ